MSFTNYTDEQILRLVKEGWFETEDLIDAGVCPICFNQKHDNVLMGDRLVYEDDNFQCFLVDKPRSEGHVIVTTKKHYRDMLEMDSDICQSVFLFTQKVMAVLKEIYGVEDVYLCSMSDKKHAHFQIQLIPKYDYDKDGHYVFAKPKHEYFEEEEKVKQLRLLISK